MSEKLPVAPVTKPNVYAFQAEGAAAGQVQILKDDTAALAHAASLSRHLGRHVNAYPISVRAALKHK